MRNPRLPALTLVASLLLSACAVPRPPEKVEAPTPAHWDSPLPASTAMRCPRRLAAQPRGMVASAERPAAGRPDQRGRSRQPDGGQRRCTHRRSARHARGGGRRAGAEPQRFAVGQPRQLAPARAHLVDRQHRHRGVDIPPPSPPSRPACSRAGRSTCSAACAPAATPASRASCGRRRPLARRPGLGRGRDRQRLPGRAGLPAPVGGVERRRPISRRVRAPDRTVGAQAGFPAPADAALARASAAWPPAG